MVNPGGQQKELPAHRFIRVGAQWKPARCKPFLHPCDGISGDLSENKVWGTIYRLYNPQCYGRTLRSSKSVVEKTCCAVRGTRLNSLKSLLFT